MNPLRWIKTIFGSSKTMGTPSSVAVPLKVSDYLAENAIAFFPAGPSKQQIIGKLIGSLDLKDPNQALKAILAREEAGTTVIAPGIGLPHARIPKLSRISAALGISPSGVVEARVSDPIAIFFLFLAPAENMKEHLAFLAAVSSLLQTKGIVETLKNAQSPKAVLEIIRHAEQA
jgi:nitrogen PTS system EIIA component